MWPFRRQRREAVRKALTAYIDKGPLTPEMIEGALARSKGLPTILSDAAHIVVVMVRDDEATNVPALLTRAIDCAVKHDAIVESVMSSFVFIVLDFPGGKTTDSQRHALVADLQQTLAGNGKIAHGRRERLHGTVGATPRMTYITARIWLALA